jgi:hypothetical protein
VFWSDWLEYSTTYLVCCFRPTFLKPPMFPHRVRMFRGSSAAFLAAPPRYTASTIKSAPASSSKGTILAFNRLAPRS